MMVSVTGTSSRERLRAWLGSVALGAAMGGVAVLSARLGLWEPLRSAAVRIAEFLQGSIGPVWVPMLVVALRVGWLAAHALRTRVGRGAPGAPVRPELGQLAPLFAALGLCGTVWGLRLAFEALDGGEFLTRLPALLGGLGAAMTSTLVGLSLQIATLLLAAFNPAWSRARVGWNAPETVFELDERVLGEGRPGLEALVEALRARQPEALWIAFDSRIPAAERAEIRSFLWQRTESAIPIRERPL